MSGFRISWEPGKLIFKRQQQHLRMYQLGVHCIRVFERLTPNRNISAVRCCILEITHIRFSQVQVGKHRFLCRARKQ